jgi:hypothetical protein
MKRIFPLSWGLITALLFWPGAAESARTIPYKITSRMWDEDHQSQRLTPPAIIEKIRKSFDLWATVEEAGLSFRDEGLVDAQYKGFEDVPADGAIYVVLNSQWDLGNCIDGVGQFRGEIPARYRGGAITINTKKRHYSLTVDILIHEIGHALGLTLHGASASDIMNEADRPWGIQEYMTLSEQDRARLIHLWNPESPGLSTISGRVETSSPEPFTDDHKTASVFAVDVKNGHAYSARTDRQGRFTIEVLRDGNYRLFAKPAEPYLYQTLAAQRPSWYVSDGQSTNDPYGGQILKVGFGNRAVGGLIVELIDQPVAFNFFRANETYGNDAPFCFMPPGTKTRLQVEEKGITALEAYGEHPDYELSGLEVEPQFKETTFANVSVDAGAEPGERLVIAKGQPGDAIQAGLIGLNVVAAIPARLSPGSVQDIADQVRGTTQSKPDLKASYKGSGRIITYKPGDPLPPELAPPPKPPPANPSSSSRSPGLLFEGVTRSYYPDGKVKLEVTYVHGLPNGVYKSYFPTGELESEGQYVDNQYDGVSKTFFKSGAVRLEQKMDHGRQVYLKEFDETGNLLMEFPPPVP